MPCRTMVATAGLARPPTMTKTTKKAKRALVAAAKVVVLVAKMAGGAGQYTARGRCLRSREATVAN